MPAPRLRASGDRTKAVGRSILFCRQPEEGAMRAIIRFSLDKDAKSALRNTLVPILEARGFRRRQRTASWEAANVKERNLQFLLRDFWRTCDQHSARVRSIISGCMLIKKPHPSCFPTRTSPRIQTETRPVSARFDMGTKQEHTGFQREGTSPMSTFFRDTAALIVVVSFVATCGVWSEVLRAIA